MIAADGPDADEAVAALAALVEIGYLSNAEQETQLATGAYQDQVAQALLDALIKFRDFLEH